MRSLSCLLLSALVVSVAACGGGGATTGHKAQCNDGKDNDGDGKIDFPDDPGCTSAEDDSEDTQPAPQCSDGRDNDGDGKIDFPADPGCFAPNQDDETDDCPSGPSCPQCSNGKDDDMNGATDYPADPGCSSASDTDEYTDNPQACGPGITINPLPADGHVSNGMLTSAASQLSATCGGPGAEDVYELRVLHPTVIVATTDQGPTSADTVLYLRGPMCAQATSELACNDDISTADHNSTLTYSATMPGTYYLVVDTKSSVGGSYDLRVQFLAGEGDACATATDCGPGLVCRIPQGGTAMVCAKHVCEDGVDDDSDGKNDYPDDPGCASPTDDDETDDCPSGPNCPECANGSDDDGDGKIDYPMDTQCQAASSTSEACQTHELVSAITTPTLMGDTTGATDDIHATCAFGTGGPDLTYQLDVPALSSLDISIDTGTTFWSADIELLSTTCTTNASDACNYSAISQTNVAAGTYYLLVDGDDSTQAGAFTLNVSGKIENGQSCESPLAQSGALKCNTGYACSGTMGSRTCQAAKCSNGIDDDADGKIDYPFDPGCTSPSDDDETDPATPPVCSNTLDDDSDMTIDFPADFGCASAADTSEVFCSLEMDAPTLITTKTTTGVTTGKSDDYTASCASSSAPELTYGLQLPVPVATLVLDTTGFDTVLSVLDTHCMTTLACNDEGPNNTTLGPSEITMNNVLPGGYAVQVDGWTSANGTFTLTVHGTVAAGTSCSSPLFSGGTSAVLVCASGTSCNATTHKCQ